MCYHKAPHTNSIPAEKYKDLYRDIYLPIPDNFYDTREGMSDAEKYHNSGVEKIPFADMKVATPEGLTDNEVKEWKYQTYFKDYLRCIASIDESIGRMLDYLEANNLMDDTVIIYTSDQGFFIGEHGWYDKRFMLEESIKMPFVIASKDDVKEGIVIDEMVSNLDFAPTFLDLAGIKKPNYMQGRSFSRLLKGEKPEWNNPLYYRYWMAKSGHCISPHYGIRTEQYKLICYLGARCYLNSEVVEVKKMPYGLNGKCLVL